MTKNKKMCFRSIAVLLAMSMLITAIPPMTLLAEEVTSGEEQTAHEAWSPEEIQLPNTEGDLPLEELDSAELLPEDTPEIVSTKDIENKGHVNRLWEQENDLNTIVFQNRDGTKTAYHYSDPVKYTDKNGKVKDKKNKLSETANGEYTNAENDINAYFPKKIHKNKGVELTFGEYTIEMAPNINGSSGASRQTGHDKDGDPTEYVEYPNVFASGVSVRYTPTFGGYKEDIILSENVGMNRFQFKLTTNGLSLVQATTGNYYLAEPLTGEYVTALGNVVVYDNTGVESEGYDHYYEVTTITADEQYLVTVVVDKRYLESENTKYPVYVDPTLDAIPKGYVQDAFIYSKPGNETASHGEVKIGYNATYEIGRGLYNFSIFDFESDFIYMYANQIVSADLNLYATIYGEDKESYNDAKTLSLYEYKSDWSPSTVKWSNTSPDNYGTLVSSTSVTSGWTAFDILPVINQIKTDANYILAFKGLLLKADNEVYTTWKKFVSTSGTSTRRPYITITYNDNPTACAQVVSGATYYFKNYSGKYLDVSNGWTTDNTPLWQYPFNGSAAQQFKIVNATGGEYEIYPQGAEGKVLSVNSAQQVIIEQDCNVSRQRWYIYYLKGSYHIVNKAYNSGVMAATYDTDYVSINNEYEHCCWELELLVCDAENYVDGENHADLHILKTIINRNNFPYYECVACGSTFKSPEEQDSDILSEADKITVNALYRASMIKEIEGKSNQMESCIRAIDKIRSKYNGYDYSYQNGQYKSPYSFAYNAGNIDISIDVSTNKYTMAEVIGNAALWNINEVLPWPYNTLMEAIKNRMTSNQPYSFADLLNLSVEALTDYAEDNVMEIVKKKNVYLYAAITAFNYTKAIVSTIQSDSLSAEDTAVEIIFYGNTVYDRFIGYYNIRNDKINVLDERSYIENRNVTGVITNMFDLHYLDCGEGYLYADRTEPLFN